MEFCLRTLGNSRDKIIKSCGKRMSETGNLMTMQDFIIQIMSKKVGMTVPMTQNKPNSLIINFPDQLYSEIGKLAVKKGVSTNALILKTVEENQ